MGDTNYKDYLIKSLKPIVKALAMTFGQNCEVVLHDLDDYDSTIIDIENNHISGRKVGGPIIGGPSDDIGLEMFIKGETDQSFIANYETKMKGKVLKSTSILFRDESEKPIAAICINYDLTEYNMAKKLIDSFCSISSINFEDNTKRSIEIEKNSVKETLKTIISESIDAIGMPVNLMDKEQKVRAVNIMHKRGVFLIKGGIERAAHALSVSRFTIYNYIDEIRNSK